MAAGTSPPGAVRVAVVGLGYWGPNLVRNLWEAEGAHLTMACDPRADALDAISRRWPGLQLTASYDEVLAAEDVDAVMLATPVGTHFAMARQALLAGKHVFVEKPLAETSDECRELLALAAQRDLTLMPGHTFLYSPPVRRVKALLDQGELGELYFGTFSRVNLGIHQSDVSVVRDLGPHDFSMLLYWFGKPEFVRAIGRDSIGSGQLDVAFVDLGLPSGALVHMEFSWLSPTKLRRTVLVGSGKMVVYDDVSTEQVRIYDRGVDSIEPASFGEHQLAYRSGDVLTPRLEVDEPLRLEVQDFVDAIGEGRAPLSSGELGLDVVRIVEAAELSLAYNNAPVAFDAPDGRAPIGDRRRSRGGMPQLRRSHD